MTAIVCTTCKDNGLVIDREVGTWDLCPRDCKEARDLDAALREGQADIEAGRVAKWSDVRFEL